MTTYVLAVVIIGLVYLFIFYNLSSNFIVASSDEINKAPEFVQHALSPSITAYRESWSRAKPLLDRDGRPFPGKHEYIAPAIAWARIDTRNGFVGLSLVESNCDGPNSATSDDIFICKATLSINNGGGTTEENVSVCYLAGDKSSGNELYLNRLTRLLEYKIEVNDENIAKCSRTFEIY